jgi:hypothetical protein
MIFCHPELVSGSIFLCHPELVSGSIFLCHPELVSGSIYTKLYQNKPSFTVL